MARCLLKQYTGEHSFIYKTSACLSIHPPTLPYIYPFICLIIHSLIVFICLNDFYASFWEMPGPCLQGAYRGWWSIWAQQQSWEPCRRALNPVLKVVEEEEETGREGFLIEVVPKLRSAGCSSRWGKRGHFEPWSGLIFLCCHIHCWFFHAQLSSDDRLDGVRTMVSVVRGYLKKLQKSHEIKCLLSGQILLHKINAVY